jgi:uncharacterized protein YpuA (DUF1002 family)
MEKVYNHKKKVQKGMGIVQNTLKKVQKTLKKVQDSKTSKVFLNKGLECISSLHWRGNNEG